MKRAMFSILVLSFCLAFGGCKKKKEAPDLTSLATHTQSITVYDLDGTAGSKYSEEDLKNASQAPFDRDLFQQLAAHAKFNDRRAMWKGSSLAIVRMKDGTKRQLAISYYGGFFKILGEVLRGAQSRPLGGA